MFGKDFYPTPSGVIEEMLMGEDLTGKVILEPSAGKGNIVDYLLSNGAKDVLACEIDPTLRRVLTGKCTLVGQDFLELKSETISHIDLIVMNPPFSADEKHILHAWDIAPDGCRIISLCNWETYYRPYNKSREQLHDLVQSYGNCIDLGDVFSTAERKTSTSIGLVRLQKPSKTTNNEYEGFFMEEEPEEKGDYGLMSYNVVRDLVNRYVGALKIYDEQLGSATKLNSLLSGFYGSALGFQCTEKGIPLLRNQFKKDLQKSGWKFIFDKMKMDKYSTKGLKEDMNKFVEQQTHIPFTMRNIYKMLEIIVGTQSQRMDKAILEVFDRLTEHYHENRFHHEGWKTNSHFVVNKRFIFPWGAEVSWSGKLQIKKYNSSIAELLFDLEKALCYLNGLDYGKNRGISDLPDDLVSGQWYEVDFFKVRCYKKGTIHCEFRDEKIWAGFNQRVAKLKGYPLPEFKEQTKYQNKQTGRKNEETAHANPVILGSFKIKVS